MWRFSLLRMNRSGFGFGATETRTRRRTAASPGVVGGAGNVRVRVLGAADRRGAPGNGGAAGLPSRRWNDDPAGKPVPWIDTSVTGAPGAFAARSTTMVFPTSALNRAPSPGVGATQLAPTTAAGRKPAKTAAAVEAGSARHNAAALTSRARKLDPMERANVDDISGERSEGTWTGCYRIVTGVPTCIRRSSLRICRFGSRTQPCETRPGRISGWLVPWIPMKPPPGQSVSTADRPFVPKARSP